MRLETPLNVAPEGSLVDIPNVIKRKTGEQVPEGHLLGTSSETTYMEIPNTSVKTIWKSPILGVSKSIRGTKDASTAEALASTQQYFSAVDRRNVNIPAGNQLTSTEVHERDIIEVPGVLTTTTVATITSSTTTPSITMDVELRGTSIPRISLPEGSPSRPTFTTTCRPRSWMQQLTEGQTNEPRREDVSSSESNSSIVDTLLENIPDELAHKWRVLHPFDLPGVRFPKDTMPPNQRWLAEKMHWWNLSKQQNIWMMYPPGDKEITDFTLLSMVILSTEEEVEEGVEAEEGESGFRKDKWIDLMEDLEEGISKVIIQEHNNNNPQQVDHSQLDKKMNSLCPLT